MKWGRELSRLTDRQHVRDLCMGHSCTVVLADHTEFPLENTAVDWMQERKERNGMRIDPTRNDDGREGIQAHIFLARPG